MLTIKASRDSLLKPLQSVTGIVERRHTLPILSNVLIETTGKQVSFLATDLEIQIQAHAGLEKGAADGSLTLSAKKLQDILRALPDNVDVTVEEKDSRVSVKAGKSRFNLQALPAADFPRLSAAEAGAIKVQIPQQTLKQLFSLVQFAMAVQDIRYYLNGLLLSIDGSTLRVVATDGHRLSYAATKLTSPATKLDVILPRKTVTELFKLLEDSDQTVSVEIRQNQVMFSFADIVLVSKVVDGKFPDYTKVIPTSYAKQIKLDRLTLLQALQRAAILSNEKIRGVRLVLTKDALSIICTNNEQEEAEEELSVNYTDEALDIGFNINYLLDVLNHVGGGEVEIAFGDANSSALVTIPGNGDFKYVVMPMRI
ncbi:MAG: DNA polymerase III subunit beta [Burkholderiales bacterium]|nr:DNA polymerase III subunit beta [Burkholderiales bacterium]